jgi:hypothetical protein
MKRSVSLGRLVPALTLLRPLGPGGAVLLLAGLIAVASAGDARAADQLVTAQAGVPALRTGPMVNQSAVKQPPPPALVANPGRNHVAFVGTTVTLNGCASGPAAKGGLLTYHWSLSTVPPGSKSAGTVTPAKVCAPPAPRIGNFPVAPPRCFPLPACQATFVVDVPGHYVATLKVGDGKQFASASTSIDTMNSPPVASASVAGGGQEVGIGSTVQLDGSRSRDADGDRLAYKWSLASAPPQSAAALRFHDTCVQWGQAVQQAKAGPGVGANGPAQECILHKTETSIPNPTLQVDRAGRYEVRLVVSDGKADSAPVIVKIDAGPAACGADDGMTFSWRAPDPAKGDKLCARGTPVNIRKVADPNSPDFGTYEWTCSAGGTSASCYSGGALVLTLDGLDPSGMLGKPQADALYLCNNLFKAPGRQACASDSPNPYVRTADPAITLVKFPWDGNAWKTEVPLAALRTVLQDLSSFAKKRHKQLAIVSHSWGTVLAYLALATLPQPSDVNVDLLVMLSTPLGTENVDFRSALLWCPLAIDPLAIAACVNVERDANAAYDTIFTFTDGWRLRQNPAGIKPRVGSVWNFWAWNDCISGPMAPSLSGASGGPAGPAFTSLDGGPLFVNDVVVDTSSPEFELNPVNRAGQRNSINVGITPRWHGYTSLMPCCPPPPKLSWDSWPDNGGLRQQVEGLIMAVLPRRNP